MAGINKVIIIGRLGRDPETRHLQTGDAVCNFSVATSEEWRDKNSGEKKEKTEWHRCTAFRKLGEICGQYLSKGSQIYLEGKLQTRQWEKDGQTHYTTEIIADTVQFLSTKTENSADGHRYSNDTSDGYEQHRRSPAGDQHPEDDIPF